MRLFTLSLPTTAEPKGMTYLRPVDNAFGPTRTKEAVVVPSHTRAYQSGERLTQAPARQQEAGLDDSSSITDQIISYRNDFTNTSGTDSFFANPLSPDQFPKQNLLGSRFPTHRFFGDSFLNQPLGDHFPSPSSDHIPLIFKPIRLPDELRFTSPEMSAAQVFPLSGIAETFMARDAAKKGNINEALDYLEEAKLARARGDDPMNPEEEKKLTRTLYQDYIQSQMFQITSTLLFLNDWNNIEQLEKIATLLEKINKAASVAEIDWLDDPNTTAMVKNILNECAKKFSSSIAFGQTKLARQVLGIAQRITAITGLEMSFEDLLEYAKNKRTSRFSNISTLMNTENLFHED